MLGNESTAKVLGYSGLIPFLVFSIGSWFTLPLIDDARYVLISYGAVILSFMGAVHWGLAMAQPSVFSGNSYIISVMPALIAWVALSLPPVFDLLLLLAGFIFLYDYDQTLDKHGYLPRWYVPLRLRLTTAVSVCLILSIAATLMTEYEVI